MGTSVNLLGSSVNVLGASVNLLGTSVLSRDDSWIGNDQTAPGLQPATVRVDLKEGGDGHTLPIF